MKLRDAHYQDQKAAVNLNISTKRYLDLMSKDLQEITPTQREDMIALLKDE
jgi:hypothetical protein